MKRINKPVNKQQEKISNIFNYFNGLNNYQYKKYQTVKYRMRILNILLNALLFIILILLLYLILPTNAINSLHDTNIILILSIALFTQNILNYVFYIMYRQTFIQRLLNIRFIKIKDLRSTNLYYFFIRYVVWFSIYILFMPVMFLLLDTFIHILKPIFFINEFLYTHTFHINPIISIILSINLWYISFFIDWIIYKRLKNNKTLADKLCKTVLIYNK